MRERGGAKEMYNKQSTPSPFTLSGRGSLTPPKKKKLCETFPGRGEESQSELRGEAVRI